MPQLTDKSQRPKRKRYLKDGRLKLVQNTASAKNARPKKIQIKYGATSALLAAEAVLHGATKERNFERHHIAKLVSHLGGPDNVTDPERSLCQASARLELLGHLCWAELLRSGVCANGTMAPAVAGYLVVIAKHIEVLKAIGMKRRAKKLPSVQEVLQSEPQTDALPGEDSPP